MFWLVKTDPDTYSWNNLVNDSWTTWDGVRNFQAKKYLSMMKLGDLVLVYHSQSEKAIVGIAEVIEEAFPDPTTRDPRWVAVKIKAVETLPKPVTLEELKKARLFANIPLLRQPRLSVMPIDQIFYTEILRLGGKSLDVNP